MTVKSFSTMTIVSLNCDLEYQAMSAHKIFNVEKNCCTGSISLCKQEEHVSKNKNQSVELNASCVTLEIFF